MLSAQVSGAYLPLLLYSLQLASILQPVSCIKIQMWKTLPVSSLHFCCCCWGGRGRVFFFLPLDFLFSVECIDWSKAHFRLTEFKNYFLCAYVFVLHFLPVRSRRDMPSQGLSHTGALQAGRSPSLVQRVAGDSGISGGILPPNWSCAILDWIVAIFRGVNRTFSSSANLMIYPFRGAYLLLQNQRGFYEALQTQRLPFSNCSVPFSPSPLNGGHSNFPGPKTILVFSPHFISESNSKER